MRNLSKSKLIAYRQCPKRLWLEIHHPEVIHNSEATKTSFKVGYQVGEIALKLYDPKHEGQVIDIHSEGFPAALARTKVLLDSDKPIFEAGFSAEGALAFADVLLPSFDKKKKGWRMVEVKSSTSVKDYHRDDAAIQAFVAISAGVPLTAIALAHIDSSWVYQGGDNYQGIFVENDLTAEAFSRANEVKIWIADAQKTANKRKEPFRNTGAHCFEPFECGFFEYCQSQKPQIEFPVKWLPSIQAKALKSFITDGSVTDFRDIPSELLNDRQHRVKSHTLSKKVYFDAIGAAADLALYKVPLYFLDFETINFAVPIWKGTRPYQQIPFQFSLHLITKTGNLKHQKFLDLSGDDPSIAFAEYLIKACGKKGTIFVYNQGFEKARIRELAERFPNLSHQLLAINQRVVDLLPIARERYYHPSQQGSWSIKNVLPAIAPDLSYGALDGVQDGGMAMSAFMEAISTNTEQARKKQIEQQLLKYCELDTYAMIRLWQYFSGRTNQQ